MTRSDSGWSGSVSGRSAVTSSPAAPRSRVARSSHSAAAAGRSLPAALCVEQLVDEVECLHEIGGRIVGDQRGMERRLELVCDERREVLEHSIAKRELCRGPCDLLLRATASNDRAERRQRGSESRPEPAAEDHDKPCRPEQVLVPPSGAVAVGGEELEGAAAVVGGPPLHARRAGRAAQQRCHAFERAAEIVRGGERRDRLLPEAGCCDVVRPVACQQRERGSLVNPGRCCNRLRQRGHETSFGRFACRTPCSWKTMHLVAPPVIAVS